MTNIGNAAHIGGLIGGFFMSMALGIDKENKQNNINGTIITVILTIFLIYLSFFK
jgi:membrane associated rhomboid family serine protease